MRKVIHLFTYIVCAVSAIAQTGPAGIGTNDGTSNLSLWLDASQISGVTTGNSITSPWLDLSGNGYNALIGGAPTYSTTGGSNGMPTLIFDATMQDYLYIAENSEIMPSSDFSVLVVANYENASDNWGGMINTSDDDAWNDGWGISENNGSGDMIFYIDDYDGDDCRLAADSPYGQDEIWALIFNSTDEKGYGYRSETGCDFNYNNAVSYDQANNNNLLIGTAPDNSGPDYFMSGDISEVIIFDKALNEAERIILVNYLSAKYDISLNSNNAYNEDNNGYDYDVAGIGRTSSTAYIDNAQGSGIVTIYNPSDLEDNEFLIWGHDNGNFLTTSNNITASGVEARLNRIWASSVAESDGTSTSDGVGTVSIQFHLESVAPSSASDLVLLMDKNDDGEFEQAEATGATYIGDEIFEFSGVTITNNDLFTVGTTDERNTPLNNVGPGGYQDGLVTWLKASESAEVTTSTDGSNVTSWEDHWTAENDAATLSTAPTYKDGSALASDAINFNPTIDFVDATDRGLEIDDDETINNSTPGYFNKKVISIAFRTGNDVTSDQMLFEQGGGSRGLHMFIDNGSIYAGAWNTLADDTDAPWGYISQSASIETETEYILTMVLEGDNGGAGSTASGTFYAYLNGRLLGTSSNIGRLFDHTDNIGVGRVNEASRTTTGSTTDALSFYGSISEIVYQNEPLSVDSERRQKLESYLALKYGITLDQSTYQVYYNANSDIIFNTGLNTAAGGFEDYDSDIAGIGRDDDSELEQQKSKSENSNTIITIDKGGSFGTDESFLIWGNDNGTNENTETSDVPASVTRRLDKSWRVAVSGTPGTIDIEFDASELTLTGSPGLDDFSLLVAASNANGSFASANVYSANSYTSDIITFEDVELTDGQFFTLGTAFYSCSPGGVSTSNLQIWLDANRNTNTNSDGVDVTSWGDLSGNDNNAVVDFFNQSTGASTGAGSAPSFMNNGINYNPQIVFTQATSEFMTIDAPESASSDSYNADRQTVFIVGKMTDASNSWSSLISKLSDDSNWDEGWSVARNGTGNNLVYAKDEEFGTTVSFTEDQPFLVSAYDDNSDYHIALDLGNEDSNGVNGHTTNGNDIFIGGSINDANTAVANFFDGAISEILVFDTDLGTTDIQKVASYLAIKYGISLNQSSATNYLASDGGTIWNASDNSSFNTAIAGIGRDDNSCLNQKQSKSEVDGSILTMGIGSIETNNRLNGNSFSADDSFLFWGHNNETTETTTSEVTTNVSSRLKRLWRVDEVGTVADVSVSFNLSGLGLSTNDTDYVLMIDTDDNLSGGTEIYGGTLVDEVITFTNVDFTDGDYFSLGVESNVTKGPGGVTDDLYVWLKANEGTSTTTNNSSLTTWSDQSGNDVDATSDGAAPLFKDNDSENLNFNPVIDFNGTDDRLVLGNLADIKSGGANNGDYTMIAVGLREDGTERNYILGSSGSADDQSLHFGYRQDNANATIGHYGNDIDVSTNAFSNPQEPFILLGEYDGAGRLIEETRGGNFARNTDSNTTDIGGSATEYIGDWDFRSSAFYNGSIAEIILFDNDIDDLKRRQIYTYLGIKYGISLTSDNNNNTTLNELVSGSVYEGDYVASNGTTIIWDYSSNSSYHYDIAGIGVDVESGLNQPKSQSEAGDALVTIDAGTIANDNSWLVWGNDNAQTEDPNAKDERPSGIKSRLNREWKVQETGTIGTVTLTFDLAGITGTDAGNNTMADTRLMRSTNSDFTSGVTLTSPATFDEASQTVSFQVDFTSTEGFYFGLGSIENSALPVTLVSFDAVESENRIRLDWITSSEEGNDHFAIERSRNGIDFETIGLVQGNGNSYASISYRFYDESPLNGRSFYRLAQNDRSGDVNYSEIRSVEITTNQVSATQNIKVYPNPTTDRIFVEGAVKEEIRILSTSGMDLTQRVLKLSEMNKVRLDLSALPKGIYLIKTYSGTQRIIKQ